MTDKKQNRDKPSEHNGSKTNPLIRTLWTVIAVLLLLSMYVLSMGPAIRLALTLSDPQPAFRVINIVYSPVMWTASQNEWLFKCLVSYQGWWMR